MIYSHGGEDSAQRCAVPLPVTKRLSNRVLIMERSRMTVVARERGLLVFLPPELLDELVEDGRVRSRCAYIGPDRDYELEAMEDATGEDFGDHVVEVEPLDSDGLSGAYEAKKLNFFNDWRGFSGSTADREDDPQEDLLQRIGALGKKGRW